MPSSSSSSRPRKSNGKKYPSSLSPREETVKTLSWPIRLQTLRVLLGRDPRQMAAALGLPPKGLLQLESGKGAFTKILKERIKRMEIERAKSVEGKLTAASSVNGETNAGKSAPLTPMHDQCLLYFLTFLSHAQRAKGGLDYTWVILTKHFPLDKFAS